MLAINLKDKLKKTSQTFKGKFEEFFQSDKDREEILEELSETMILADVGIPSTEKIIDILRQKSKKSDPFPIIKQILEEEIIKILSQYPNDLS